jgi:hypothetical protein
MLKNTLKIIVSMIMCVLSFTFIHIRTTRKEVDWGLFSIVHIKRRL